MVALPLRVTLLKCNQVRLAWNSAITVQPSETSPAGAESKNVNCMPFCALYCELVRLIPPRERPRIGPSGPRCSAASELIPHHDQLVAGLQLQTQIARRVEGRRAVLGAPHTNRHLPARASCSAELLEPAGEGRIARVETLSECVELLLSEL